MRTLKVYLVPMKLSALRMPNGNYQIVAKTHIQMKLGSWTKSAINTKTITLRK